MNPYIHINMEEDKVKKETEKQELKVTKTDKGIKVEINAGLSTAILLLATLVIEISEKDHELTSADILKVLIDTVEEIEGRKKINDVEKIVELGTPLIEWLEKHSEDSIIIVTSEGIIMKGD